MKSLTPTNSASVELLVFNFCLVEPLYANPFPSDIAAPLWLRISPWTANEASIHHLTTLLSSASRVNGNLIVPLRYWIILFNFFQSCVSGHFTRVLRKPVANWMSGRARLHRKMAFATRWWNNPAVFSSSFVPPSSISNRWLAAGVDASPIKSSGTVSVSYTHLTLPTILLV